jgi:hypothetical protein
MGSGVLLGLSPSKFGHPNRALRRAELLIPLWRLAIDLARNVANGRAQVFVNSQVNDALRRTPLPFVRIQGLLRRMIKPASFIRNPRSIQLQI